MNEDIKLLSKNGVSEEDWNLFLTRLDIYLSKGIPDMLRDYVNSKNEPLLDLYYHELRKVINQPDKFPLPIGIKKSSTFKEYLSVMYNELGDFISKIILKDTSGMNESLSSLQQKVNLIQMELKRLITILLVTTSFYSTIDNPRPIDSHTNKNLSITNKNTVDFSILNL